MNEDLDDLVSRGLMTFEEREAFMGLHRDPDDYPRTRGAVAKALLSERKVGMGVSIHPELQRIISMATFAHTLMSSGMTEEGEALANRCRDLIEIIDSAYLDEENPFPFREVSSFAKIRRDNIARADMLRKFLEHE